MRISTHLNMFSMLNLDMAIKIQNLTIFSRLTFGFVISRVHLNLVCMVSVIMSARVCVKQTPYDVT